MQSLYAPNRDKVFLGICSSCHYRQSADTLCAKAAIATGQNCVSEPQRSVAKRDALQSPQYSVYDTVYSV